MNLHFFTIFILFAMPALAGEAASVECLARHEWARDNGAENEHSCATESPTFNAGGLSYISESQPTYQDSVNYENPAINSDDFELPAGYDFSDDEFTILE